jgi:hypothetical protein
MRGYLLATKEAKEACWLSTAAMLYLFDVIFWITARTSTFRMIDNRSFFGYNI